MKSDLGNFILVSAFEYMNRETVSFRSDADFVDIDLRKEFNQEMPYALLGISESIGPIANYGRSGAENAFPSFLSFFRRMPKQTLPLSFLGCIEYKGSMVLSPEVASNLVKELDDFIFTLLKEKVSPKQVPIIIGGGHNNALPLMRWVYNLHGAFHVVNIDAHADCRPTKKRHSGNSFSTAIDEGIVAGYSVLGLHQNNLSSTMKTYMQEKSVFYTFYEDYLLERRNLIVDFNHAIKGHKVGLEMDLDSIANMPSSAQSPSGWGLDDIRKLLLEVNPADFYYLHLTEAAPKNDAEERVVGKALGYLCLDFIKIKE